MVSKGESPESSLEFRSMAYVLFIEHGSARTELCTGRVYSCMSPKEALTALMLDYLFQAMSTGNNTER